MDQSKFYKLDFALIILTNVSTSFLPGGMNPAGAKAIPWIKLINRKGESTFTMVKSTFELFGE